MPLTNSERLARLGAGASIDSVCREAGLTRAEFDRWWQAQIAARVPPSTGICQTGVTGPVRIHRDACGIPHIQAEREVDLWFGFGFAVAQDRLFQLDYLRRRGLGRLAEVLGPEALELDLTARTVGLPHIAENEWRLLPAEARMLLEAYAAGINAHIAACGDRLPIEFDLLGYRPEPWRPQDSLAIIGEFRWYLTGRFPVIVIPELAKRTLGAGAAYEAFLQAESDEESILPRGAYPSRRDGVQPVGVAINDPAEGHGSNNWVVSGDRSVSGAPLVASDPHIAFAAVSCWHEVHLCGGRFNTVGTAYVGMPALLFGRNEQVAWGITNNICSLRDLYQERTDPQHPGCFEFDGQWEPARERVEEIRVRGADLVRHTVCSSRHGPVVNAILPAPARGGEPVSLKWQGAAYCGWFPALVEVNRAGTADELRRALKPWRVPTFCVVYADVQGNIGYQCTGQIPIRNVWERGYRPGWDPQQEWAGLIPFEAMPHWSNPERGWIATANNRVAPNDFPYPLAGTWSNGYRGVRLRTLLEGQPRFSRDDFARFQQDSLSLRAVELVPRVVAILERLAAGLSAEGTLTSAEQVFLARLSLAAEVLRQWNCQMEPESVAAALFNVFFDKWCQRIAGERFPEAEAALVAGAIGGLAGRLLDENAAEWFGPEQAPELSERNRGRAIREAIQESFAWLANRLGEDLSEWRWGRLHLLQQQHVLSTRGDLGKLLDRGGVPVRGDFITICNTGQAVDYAAPSGAGYRMIADLADPQAGLWAVDAGSQSGQPGSVHYDDQLGEWHAARYHYLPLTGASSGGPDSGVLQLVPV